MTEYLDIGKEAQSELIRELKSNCPFSWTDIADNLGVNRSMMFPYLRGESKISREKLMLFAKIANYTIDEKLLNFIEADFGEKKPSLPAINSDLAEFLGILYGDGCLSRDNYLIDISGSSKADLLYHKTRVGPLLKNLFNLEPRYKFQRNCIHTGFGAKLLHGYLSDTFSFPIGEKKGRMHIPPKIYEKDEYKYAFLRGLFDTDGGIDYHHFRSSQIHYTCFDPIFLKEVFDLYKNLGFNAKLAKKRIKMFDREEISRFFSEVCPANPKHQYKYQTFLKTGWVPRHRDIDYSLLNASAGNRTQVRTLEGSNVTIAPRSQT